GAGLDGQRHGVVELARDRGDRRDLRPHGIAGDRLVGPGCGQRHRASRLRIGLDRGELRGDVDADRTPGDAAATPDAPAHAELTDPRGELVGHPLAVALARVRPKLCAVDGRVLGGEARVPLAHALAALGPDDRALFDAVAKAGRTHERAVATAQAALGDVVPAWVVEVVEQQLWRRADVELGAPL